MFDFPPTTPWIYAWLGAAALVGLVIGWLLGRIGAGRYKRERNGLRAQLDEALEARRSSEEALTDSGGLAADLQHQLDESRSLLSDADRDIERLRVEVNASDTRVAQLEKEVLDTRGGDSEQVDQLTARLSASHEEIDSLRAALSAATSDTDSRVAAAESETQEALRRAAAVEEALSAARLETENLRKRLQDDSGTTQDTGYADDLKAQLAAATADAEAASAAAATAEAELQEAAARLDAAYAELDEARSQADTQGDVEGELAARDHLVRELQERVAGLAGIEDRLKAREAELGELRRTQAAVLAAKEAEARGLRERIETLSQTPAAPTPEVDDEAAEALQAALDELAAVKERAARWESEAASLRAGIAAPPRAPAAKPTPPIAAPVPMSASVEERLDMMQEVLADKEARIAYLADRVARLESNLGTAARYAPALAPGPISVPSPLAPAPATIRDPRPEPAPEPDDLTRIWGIGPAIQRKLNSVGIATFEQIAVLGPSEQAQLGDILGDFLDRFEADDWVGQARRFIIERGGTVPDPPLQPIRLIPPPAPALPDDLTQIKGIGPYIQATLNGLGVTTYAQIAAWTESEVAEFGEALVIFRDRIAREGWVEQARRLMRRS